MVQHELFSRLDPERLWVLAGWHPDAASYDSEQLFHIERVRSSRLTPVPWVAARVDRLVRTVRPDVVVFGSALPLSLLGVIPRQRGVPYVSMVYGADVTVPMHIGGLASAEKLVLSRADGIVAMGPWVAGQVRRVLGPGVGNICAVCPGVDTDRFCPSDAQTARRNLGLDPDRPTVTSISRLVPRKGMRFLIHAAAVLRDRLPDLQVAIAGEGREYRHLREAIRRHRLSGTVRLLGEVPASAVADVHRAGDVCAMLCHDRWRGVEQEGFGIVLVEASACGRPVVAGRSGGAVDAVQDGVTGTLVDARNVPDVVTALASYLENPEHARLVGAQGRRRAESVFRWDLQAARFVTWLSDFSSA